MASEKQIQANRNNAKKSTGPQTEEGKARASQNALKHGLLTQNPVLPGEDPAEFQDQLAALEADIQPEGALEHELVRQIADAQWRMRRLSRLETAYLLAAIDNRRETEGKVRPGSRRDSEEENTLTLGYTVMGRTQALSSLARYDAHLGRRFERAIQQLTRLREAREKRRNTPTDRAPIPRTASKTPASEDCEANPISSNQNGFNEIADTKRTASDAAQSDDRPSAPQAAPEWPQANHSTPNGGFGSRRDPQPR